MAIRSRQDYYYSTNLLSLHIKYCRGGKTLLVLAAFVCRRSAVRHL
jgi:hypothetical protein